MNLLNRKYINLMREFTLFVFKSREQGTVLGFMWTLLHPLIMLTILYMLFSKRLGRGIDHYEIYLLIGIVQWNFLTAGTNEGLKSIMKNRAILRNIYVPPIAIVISTVFAVFISFSVELLVLGGFILFSGLGFSPVILFLPAIIIMQLLLVTGISLVLSCLNVYFKDTAYIWNVILKIGFFVTPIFYSVPMFISRTKMTLYFLNPMTQLMVFMRQIIVFKSMPSLTSMLLVFLGVLAILSASWVFFRKVEDSIIERI